MLMLEPQVDTGSVSLRLLAACSEIYATWFKTMRSAIMRERERQRSFKSEKKIPRNERVEYREPELTEAEASTLSILFSLVKSMFGDFPAEYAMDMFRKAVKTGDMRVFKIRILFFKTRDSLKGSPLYRAFMNGMDQYVSMSEEKAGCIPDPSPKRLTRQQKENRDKKQKIREYISKYQLELPLVWPDPQEVAPEKGDFSGLCTTDHISVKNSCECNESLNNDINCMRYSNEKRYSNAFCNANESNNNGFRRKAREYETVDEIIEDAEAGLIDLYESTEDILEDVKNGNITPVEAMMFTSAIERLYPSVEEDDQDIDIDDEMLKLEKEIEGGETEGDDMCAEYDLHEEDNDSEEYGDDYGYEGREGISYNPKGFGGCAGSISQSGADWNTDDECV